MIRLLSQKGFGGIKKVVSDQAKVFKSRELKKWADERGIEVQTGSPYHAASNGLSERLIRDLKMYISLFPDFPGGWKCALEAAVTQHNRSHCKSIGCSPEFAVSGTPPILQAPRRNNNRGGRDRGGARRNNNRASRRQAPIHANLPEVVEAEALIMETSETEALSASQSETFILDSGSTHNMCSSRKWMTSYHSFPVAREVKLGGARTLSAQGSGGARITFMSNGRPTTVLPKNVLSVPRLRRNFLSTSQLADDGFDIRFK